MSESVSANAKWQYDYIDHYRLDENIIEGFLNGKWGNYRYFVQARPVALMRIHVPRLTWRSARAMNGGSGCPEPLATLVHVSCPCSREQ